MANVRDLPVEILEAIFSLILFHTYQVPQIWQQPFYEHPLWRNEASEIGYTCRLFNRVIKSLLFRRLSLKDLKSLAKLASFVEKSDKYDTDLAPSVRWLFLDTRCTPDESNMVRRALVEIVTRCSNIDYLCIGFIDVPGEETLVLPRIAPSTLAHSKSSIKSITLRFSFDRTQKPYQSAYRLNDRHSGINLHTVLPPTYPLFIKRLAPNLFTLELQDIDFSRMDLTVEMKRKTPKRGKSPSKRAKVQDSVFYRRSEYFELTLDTVRVLILNRCTLDPSESITKVQGLQDESKRKADVDYFEDVPDTSAFLAVTFRDISSLFFVNERPAGLGSLTRLFKNLRRLYLHRHPMVHINANDVLSEPTITLPLSMNLLQQLDVLEAINFNYLPSFLTYFNKQLLDQEAPPPLKMKRLVVKDDYKYGDSPVLKDMICNFLDTVGVSSGKEKFTDIYETNRDLSNSRDYRTMFCPLLQVSEYLGVEVWTFRASTGQSYPVTLANSSLVDSLPVTIPLHEPLRNKDNLFPTDTLDVPSNSKILRTPLVKLALQSPSVYIKHPVYNAQGLLGIETAPLNCLPWID